VAAPKQQLPNHKYAIGKSVHYETRGFGPPPAPTPTITEPTRILGAEAVLRPAARPEQPRPPRTAEELGRPSEKHAVWIVHGMGQQIPFETLDSLTTGILKVADRFGARIPGSRPRVTAVKFGPSGPGGKEQVVERVEIDLQDKEDAKKSCQLHLYEAYWAPVTEGAAKLSDVISFFFNGGMRSIWNSGKPFLRAMFPDESPAGPQQGMQQFKIPFRAVLEVTLTLLLLLSLIAINAVIVSAGAAKASIPAFTMMRFDQHWKQLSAIATGMCAIALSFGVILFLGEMCKPANLARWKKLFISIVGWIGFSVTALTILASAALMSTVTRFQWVAHFLKGMNSESVQGVSTLFLLAAAFLVVVSLVSRASKRSSGTELRGDPFLVFLFVLSFALHLAVIPALVLVARSELTLPAYLPAIVQWAASLLANPLWVWPALIVLAKLVRDLLIQFPGDVAIYVDSNKLDRFCKIRQEIKQIASDSVTGIYTARSADDSSWEYSKIAIVGHSLGSVIAYDTLNKLLNLDDITGNHVDVEKRTCLLETFGSPLDKIAFFFTIQGKETFHIREQLAAVVQPLIQSYAKFRTFPWVNVYSGNDIVSGSLQFYDLPDTSYKFNVENIPDPDAVVPLAAHVDYWKNDLVWQQLYARIAP
jgi:hypothetical protein